MRVVFSGAPPLPGREAEGGSDKSASRSRAGGMEEFRRGPRLGVRRLLSERSGWIALGTAHARALNAPIALGLVAQLEGVPLDVRCREEKAIASLLRISCRPLPWQALVDISVMSGMRR